MKRIIALALFAVAPQAANAAVIQLDYSGTVTSILGDGLGYSVNDTIAGSLFIDTDLASPPDTTASTTETDIGSYRGPVTDPGFVVGGQLGAGDAFADALDAVLVADRTAPGGVDAYVIINRSANSSGFVRGETIQVADLVVDFIFGIGLDQNFSLNAADDMSGSVFDYQYDPASPGVNFFYNEAKFSLSTIDARVVGVPEPATLAHLGLALVGMAFARRRWLN